MAKAAALPHVPECNKNQAISTSGQHLTISQAPVLMLTHLLHACNMSSDSIFTLPPRWWWWWCWMRMKCWMDGVSAMYHCLLLSLEVCLCPAGMLIIKITYLADSGCMFALNNSLSVRGEWFHTSVVHNALTNPQHAATINKQSAFLHSIVWKGPLLVMGFVAWMMWVNTLHLGQDNLSFPEFCKWEFSRYINECDAVIRSQLCFIRQRCRNRNSVQ